MKPVIVRDQLIIGAPAGRVWEAVQDPARHAGWHPFIERIHGRHARGAVRVCDILIRGRSGRTEETCVLYDEQARIFWRIEKDTSGFSKMASDWTAGFTMTPHASGTVVSAESTFTPKGLFPRLANPLITRMFHRTQRLILARLKAYVEADESESREAVTPGSAWQGDRRA